MEILCPNKNDKEFRKIVRILNVSSRDIENAIGIWYDYLQENNRPIKGNEHSSNNVEFISFMEQHFNIRGRQKPYSSKARFNQAHKVWEEFMSKYSTITDASMLESIKAEANKVFGSEYVSLYETNKKGVYALRIAEPIYSKGTTSPKTISAQTKFSTAKSASYPQRTQDNADWSDITLAFAVDFNTRGENLTAQVAGSTDPKHLGAKKPIRGKKDKYIPYTLSTSGDHTYDADEIVELIKDKKLPTRNIKLNIAGNSINTLINKGWTQEQINDYITSIIRGLQEAGITISEIRSGGQTGVDEAGIIAAQRLGIPSEVHATSDWTFRDSSGKDISDETLFKARFGSTPSKETSKVPADVNTSSPVRLINFGKNKDFTVTVGSTYNAKLGNREVQITILGSNDKQDGKLATDVWFTISDNPNQVSSVAVSTMAEWIVEDSSPNQEGRKTYSGMVDTLSENQIFVFGSNTQGRHGMGAAKTAKDKFGAKYGQAEGLQGQSYAIITKDLTKDDKKNPSRTKEQIKEQIHKLYEFARQNPNKEFLVAYSKDGKNLNYYSNEDMAEMFASEEIPSNIVFEEGFNSLVEAAKGKKESLVVNPKFFNVQPETHPSVRTVMEELNSKLGKIVNIRPLTKKELEEENGLGSDAIIEFSSGEVIELSFLVGSMALNGKKAYSMFKALGREIDNPYRKGEKAIDTKNSSKIYFAATNLAYEYFVANPDKLIALNLGENPLVTLNKSLRGDKYDASKDDIARGSEAPFIVKESERKGSNIVASSSKLQESKALVDRIIQDSKDTIKFDPKTHTYYVGGKKADTSVTEYIHGKLDLGAWGLPSSVLGNTVDTITRDFFNGTIKKSYPNLTKRDLNNLIGDLNRLKEHFNDKFGEGNYGIVTEEFPIAAKYTEIDKQGKAVTKVMAGTMDMLIYDNKGNFYIYDMKTSRSGISNKKKIGYAKQLSLYKSILEANYPELKGKIKELKLIEFSLFYPDPEVKASNPNPVQYASSESFEEGIEGQLYVSEDGENFEEIQDSPDYIPPRLNMTDSASDALVALTQQKINVEFNKMDSEDLAIMEEETGSAPVKVEEYSQSKEDAASSSLYNNPILSATERNFLSGYVMNLTSFIITHLQTDPRASEKYFGNKFAGKDFTGMSRVEIIETVGLGNIFAYIKEAFYNPKNRLDIDSFITLKKLKVAYENFPALIKAGYAKLITLEGVTVVDARPEDIMREDIEDALKEDMESGSLEEKGREHWQIGQRQISARASLSGEIKRAFEKLFVKDMQGDNVKDKFGFNLDTFVDSGVAINSILSWTNEAETIEEMEEILQRMATSNPWVNSILEEIKKEPFRSQFYQNFRKDFTRYSIITAERDEKGNVKYVTNVINTKGAAKALLDNITVLYRTGLMKNLIIPIKGDIEGRGRVNIKNVESLKKRKNEVVNKLNSNFGRKGFYGILTSSIPEITQILNELGITVDTNTLKAAFSRDSKVKNIGNTSFMSVLNNIGYLLDTLESNKGNDKYNPILKGEDAGNIYSNYKNIINVLSKYIQDSIEASTYENGKMHYSFVTPSYMGNLVKQLSDALGDERKFNRFIQENYGSYRWFKDGDTWNNVWLDKIVKSSEVRKNLQHKVQLSFDKTPYTDLSELGYTLSLMHEYFYDRNKKWAWYRLPILSNKPSSEFVRFERYSGNYERTITRGLKKILNQEIMRIKTVLERAVNEDVNKIGVKEKTTFDIKDSQLMTTKGGKKIKDTALISRIKKGKLTLNDLIRFKGSGAEFKFLPALNENLRVGDELGQLILAKINGTKIDETRLDKLFTIAIESYMDNMVSREISQWEKIGLYDTKTVIRKQANKEVKTEVFKYVNQLGKTREEVDANLREYIWNDMFATINLIQLTATDLAYYRNIEDFQKRYAQVHSPSMRLNITAKDSNGNLYSKDGKERTIYLKDSIVASEIVTNVAKVFDDKIATLKGAEKEQMRMMKDLIISDFEDINVADAQGYSSPTSYRKKMGMMGKWTPEMEEAYNRIKSGDFNVNDLGVVWQPLKPFVYSQIRKTSGASTMSELKVPVQNKNSEYLLILADAIMRGGNKVNRLTAIYDFMEDSAYSGRVSRDGKVIKEGTYNGIGIDTVQFESAVNSGSMGSIDISNAKSYKEIKKILNDAVYYNSDMSESNDNDMDIYNDQFVHTIPFEDYGIQQEVPAHLVDHEQLMGSQVRILSISDITPGTIFKVGKNETIKDSDLINEYQTLLADNIRESFNKLAKDLNLGKSRLKRNQALSKLLQEAILKDQRYGADLLRACSLDENGEFIIPLSDPIQSVRIQQLINSIIKSRINKQKVKGGPVVQASVFGMSDDLNIVWKDKKGNILPTRQEFKGTDKQYEAFIKENQDSVAYFECYMPIPSEALEKALTKEDGSIMSMEEAVKAKIITEEMRKAIGYRIPTEDKYSMAPLYIKGFLPKAAGEAIMLPKEITKLAGSDFDIDKMYIMLKEFELKEVTDWRSLKSDLLKESKTVGSAKIKKRNELDIIIDEIKNGSIEFSEGSEEMRVYDYYIDNKSKYTEIKFVEGGESKRSRRNNRVFDLQWAVLTNHDTMDKLFNPGSFNTQKKTARIISILKSGSKHTYDKLSKMDLKDLEELAEASTNKDILFSTTQVYFHKQNMTAGKLIGIFANNNASHAFLSMQDIYFNFEDGGFTFNGVKVNNEMNNKLDAQKAKDGTLISKNIAGFLAASVDAVKDPVLNFMNLNTVTAGTAMVLARLGFSSDSIGLLLTQPIIEKVTSEYFKRNNEGYASIDEVINAELEDLKKNHKIDYKILSKDLANTSFSMSQLSTGISKGLTNTEFQARALLLFQKLSSMAQDLGTLTFLTKFNSVTNAVGPTIADTLVMRERYNKFLDKMENNPPFNESAKRVIENSPLLEAFYDTTVSDRGASRLIFRDYFPQYSAKFTEVLDRLRTMVKSNLDSKTINKLVSEFVLYKLSIGNNPVLDASPENRSRFINNFIEYFRETSADIIDNDLINIITLKPRDNRCPVDTLEAKTGGYTVDIQERVKDAWANLMGNKDTRELAVDLFFYNMFRSGFNFSPKTFMHLASVDVKRGIDGYIESIENVEFNDLYVNVDEFLYQFLRNHTQESKLVPTLPAGIKYKTSKNVANEDVITFSYNNNSDAYAPIIISETKESIRWAPVIIFNDTIYMNPVDSGNTVSYTKTTALGNSNNFLEYNGNEDSNMKSVLGKSDMAKEEKGSAVFNDTVYEPRKSSGKAVNAKDINKAIEAVFTSEQVAEAINATSVKTVQKIMSERIDEVVEDIMNMLGKSTNIGLKKVIKDKVSDRIKKMC